MERLVTFSVPSMDPSRTVRIFTPSFGVTRPLTSWLKMPLLRVGRMQIVILRGDIVKSRKQHLLMLHRMSIAIRVYRLFLERSRLLQGTAIRNCLDLTLESSKRKFSLKTSDEEYSRLIRDELDMMEQWMTVPFLIPNMLSITTFLSVRDLVGCLEMRLEFILSDLSLSKRSTK